MSTSLLKRASHSPFALGYAGPAVIVCCLTALVRPALPASITDLGTLGGSTSYAYGINASGQVVGWSDTTGDATAPAFLYSGGSAIYLNSLLPAGSGWDLIEADAINDSGQIVWDGDHRMVRTTPFFWTPRRRSRPSLVRWLCSVPALWQSA